MFEYSAVSVPNSDPQDLARELTEKSAEGWEVVDIFEVGGRFSAFIKRPLQKSREYPTSASSTNVPRVPAAWYADPSGRYELRYWDGSEWTEHVARGGQQFVDPPVA